LSGEGRGMITGMLVSQGNFFKKLFGKRDEREIGQKAGMNTGQRMFLFFFSSEWKKLSLHFFFFFF
jgi:hypothetical protein